MSTLKSFLKLVWNRTLPDSSGFTLVSQAVIVFIGSTALLGGWAAYRDFNMQWRVSNAERQMDQYAHSTMTGLINIFQSSWGAQELASGRSPIWRFAIMEAVKENLGLNSTSEADGHYPYQTDNFFTANQYTFGHSMDGGFVRVSAHPDRGVLINGTYPKWANPRTSWSTYFWRGNARIRPDELSCYDSRDRMQMTSLELDYEFYNDPNVTLAGESGKQLKFGVITIRMVLQYRYRADDIIGLYGDDYIRERVFETKIFPLNHGSQVNSNPFWQQFGVSGQLG
jgi:hypothetical protein